MYFDMGSQTVWLPLNKNLLTNSQELFMHLNKSRGAPFKQATSENERPVPQILLLKVPEEGRSLEMLGEIPRFPSNCPIMSWTGT